MKTRIQVSNVDWDFSDLDEGATEPILPTSFVLEMDEEDPTIDDISDAISNEYGFCHTGFKFYKILPMVNRAGD